LSVRIPPADTFPEFYAGPDGQVWELLSYATAPTATIRNLKTGEERGGVVGSPILEPFTRLVPESKS
jgi:hypothetical protein